MSWLGCLPVRCSCGRLASDRLIPETNSAFISFGLYVSVSPLDLASLVVTPTSGNVVTDASTFTISYSGAGSYLCYKLSDVAGSAWTVCDAACTGGMKATGAVSSTALSTNRWLSAISCDSSHVLIDAVVTRSFAHAGSCKHV